jgi:hypothetical protein
VQEADSLLQFVRVTRQICQFEKYLVEKRLQRHVLAVKIYHQEVMKARRKLCAADADIGKVRACLCHRSFPIISTHSHLILPMLLPQDATLS